MRPSDGFHARDFAEDGKFIAPSPSIAYVDRAN